METVNIVLSLKVKIQIFIQDLKYKIINKRLEKNEYKKVFR